MSEIDRVKSAGNKHLWVFYAQAVGGAVEELQVEGQNRWRKEHTTLRLCAYRISD